MMGNKKLPTLSYKSCIFAISRRMLGIFMLFYFDSMRRSSAILFYFPVCHCDVYFDSEMLCSP